MSIDQKLEDIENTLAQRNGYENKVAYEIRNRLETRQYSVMQDNALASYCDGDCGTDSDGSGVCYCDDDH